MGKVSIGYTNFCSCFSLKCIIKILCSVCVIEKSYKIITKLLGLSGNCHHWKLNYDSRRGVWGRTKSKFHIAHIVSIGSAAGDITV